MLRTARPRDAASVSLELALAVPVVAIVAVALLQVLGVARDALLAQDLARLGVRVAATSTSDAAVRQAVLGAAGPDVRVTATVTPSVRARGDLVSVEVALRRPGRMIEVTLSGRAVAHGEPQLDAGRP